MGGEQDTAIIASPPDCIRCQVAVLGSGPGGSVVASRLAAAGRDVLLIEEGPYLSQSSCEPYSPEEMETKYRSGGVSFAFGRPKVTYVEARCAGGGSEINAGLYYRTPPEVLEAWRRDFAVAELAPGQLDHHFESIEKALDVLDTTEESGGAGARLRLAAEKAKLKSVNSRSSFPRHPAADHGDSRAQRASMTRTYLPAAFRFGARLVPNCRVESFHREGGSWVVRCVWAPVGVKPRRIAVHAETLFLSCGAIQTPALLRRSGIKRNVGRSLAMHATAKVTARFADDVNHLTMGVPTQAVDEFAPRFAFTCASSSPGYLALEMMQFPKHFPKLEKCWPRMAVYSARIAGGVGQIDTLPGFSDPLVRFKLGDDDLRDLFEAIRELCTLLFEAGAEELYPSLLLGEPLRRPKDLDCIPMPLSRSRTNLMTIHLFSSCPMGENLERCAVDSFGRVHGVDSLYVADASLLCTAPTVNPQGSIMAVVERNAMHFLGEL